MRPALTLAVLAFTALRLSAQAVERTDTPHRGAVRLSFDPTIMVWDAAFTPRGREPLGAFLTSDSLGAAAFPSVARLQQDIRANFAQPGGLGAAFLATLGKSLLAVEQERRVTPIGIELGITNRLAVSAMVPVVRVRSRSRLLLDSTTATLGINPRLTVFGAESVYTKFFGDFDASLAQLDANIASNAYGCPAGPRCALAQAIATQGHAMRSALGRGVYGLPGDPATFLPLQRSDGGTAIDSTLAYLQRQLDTLSVPGFADTMLLPANAPTANDLQLALGDTIVGYDVAPFQETPRLLRFFPGDAEVEAKYRLVGSDSGGGPYAAAVAFVSRLPTGHQDSPSNLLDIATGDHQTDFELRVIQEFTIAHRLWLNLSLTGTMQRPGTRVRRVAPPWIWFAPRASITKLAWDPGNYAAIDFAPLYRFDRHFSAGLTASYYTHGRDSYTFLSPQDSVALAGRLGGPISASVLDAGTVEHRVRFGVSLNYIGPRFETNATVEQTVRGDAGMQGGVPAATVFRIVMRVTRQLF